MSSKHIKKAIILLSGGLDSSTVLYFAKKRGYKCYCLIFDYGQRHRKEIKSAILIAKAAHSKRQIVKIGFPWQGSSLLDKNKKIPNRSTVITRQPLFKKTDNSAIPSTYVPGRNIIFLSFAVSYAEAIGANAIFIGANARDFSGYPDCRPKFYEAFRKAVKTGTKTGATGRNIGIITPLINMSKADIVRLGFKLKVPYELTWSCYEGNKEPCGKCDSCLFRLKGFKEAGFKDSL